jgi:hypothetical protein
MYGSTFFVTTLPAATWAILPTVIPGKTITEVEIVAPSSIVTSLYIPSLAMQSPSGEYL